MITVIKTAIICVTVIACYSLSPKIEKVVQPVIHKILLKGGVLMEGFDMEVTKERAEYMKNLLVMLYADQIGMEVKSIKVTPVGETKEPA